MRAGLCTILGLALLSTAVIDSAASRSDDASSEIVITPAAQKEIGKIKRRIDDTEAGALAQLKTNRLDRSEQITRLGNSYTSTRISP